MKVYKKDFTLFIDVNDERLYVMSLISKQCWIIVNSFMNNYNKLYNYQNEPQLSQIDQILFQSEINMLLEYITKVKNMMNED